MNIYLGHIYVSHDAICSDVILYGIAVRSILQSNYILTLIKFITEHLLGSFI